MDMSEEERKRTLASNLEEIGEENYKALRALYLANGRSHSDLLDVLSQDMVKFMNDPISHFREMGLPESHPIFLHPDEVTMKVREYSKQIFEQWKILRLILERHEDCIRKRWMNKPRGQRKKILLTAWPNMETSHRPEYQAYAASQLDDRRDAYLFPEINLQDLMQPSCLLIFINARGRHPPELFSHADLEAIRFGLNIEAIKRSHISCFGMYLRGTSPQTYGQFVSRHENNHYVKEISKRLMFTAGDGLVILERQARILLFLAKVCRTILHEMDEATLLGEHSLLQPEPPALSAQSHGLSSISEISQEALYRLPELLNLERLKAVIFAKRSSAEDHVWNLREDPGYFAKVATAWYEHRPELILDDQGLSHPTARELGNPTLWNSVLAKMIEDAYGNLFMWDLIYSQVLELARLKDKYAKLITRYQELPEEYMMAFVTLNTTLRAAAQIFSISNLSDGLCASPLLRSRYVRSPPKLGRNCLLWKDKRGYHGRVNQKQPIDYMVWLFASMWTESKLLQHGGLPNVMNELERLFQSSREVKSVLSNWVSEQYSDLGVIAVAQHELSLFLPWTAGMIYESVGNKDTVEKEQKKIIKPLTVFFFNSQYVSMAKLGAPTDNKFDYPSHKRRTRQNVNIMRRSEGNLETFWESIDNQYEKLVGTTLQDTFKHLLSKERNIERTVEFVEPPKQPTKKSNSDSIDGLHTPFGNWSVSSGDHLSKKTFEPPKEKIKTRGLPASEPADQGAEPDANTTPQETNLKSKFIVSKKVAKVFSTLFFTPQTADLPGEIPWTDFLSAMVATGFNPVKLYGSAWQFTPTNLDLERSIQFHEPHPIPKIPFWMARRHGRRLNRAYGWEGDMFETI